MSNIALNIHNDTKKKRIFVTRGNKYLVGGTVTVISSSPVTLASKHILESLSTMALGLSSTPTSELQYFTEAVRGLYSRMGYCSVRPDFS